MKISGFQKFSLIDYPGKITAIVFTQGCNFLCPYCHNPELIPMESYSSYIEQKTIFDFLKSRIGKLEGVSITGGEPTLQKDLPEFIKTVKQMKFSVKLDTNGINPKMLKQLTDDKLIDYIAMDIKAPFGKYNFVTGVTVNIENIKKSINIIINSNIQYEFRTTVVKDQLSLYDIKKIKELINNDKNYFIQKFKPTKCYNPEFLNKTSYTDKELTEYFMHINIR